MTHASLAMTMDAAADSAEPRVPVAYHAIAAAFVALCCWMALRHPALYAAAVQEDRVIEWATVWVYGVAGVVATARAVRARRVFDALVGLFLIFVAGEEMSWGQRLLGLTPPSYFLEHNTQLEMNVHNFANILGGPKGPFTLVLVGYGLVMPLAASLEAGRRLMRRIGATPPPIAIVPWFIVAILLFTWYPFDFTGEWTELLAGSAFLMAMGLPAITLLGVTVTGALFAIGLTAWSSRGLDDPALVTCARQEIAAIADALDPVQLDLRAAHRRVWSMAEDRRIDAESVRARLGAVPCDDPDAESRRRFIVDPWGTAYWIRVERDSVGVRTTVYSFGPNRRRDLGRGASRTSDDLLLVKPQSTMTRKEQDTATTKRQEY